MAQARSLSAAPYNLAMTAALGLLVVSVYEGAQAYAAMNHAWALMHVTPTLTIDEALRLAHRDGRALALGLLASSLLASFLVLALILSRKPQITLRRYLAIHPVPLRRYLLWLLVFVAFSWGIQFLLGLFAAAPDPSFLEDPYREVPHRWMIWLPVVITVPIFEEIFFRGFLFAGLRQSSWGEPGAIAITAVAWAMMHLQYSAPGLTLVLGLGLVLGAARAQTGSILPPLGIHVANNIVAMIQMANRVGS